MRPEDENHRLPILTSEFLSQPLPSCYVTSTWDRQSAVSWRSLQNLLDLTVLPGNWSWEDLHSHVLASAHGTSQDNQPNLSVAVACTGRLTLRTAHGTILRTGAAAATATRPLTSESGLPAYDGALISASRTAFKRACYLLGRVYGQDLGNRDFPVRKLLELGNRTLTLPLYMPAPRGSRPARAQPGALRPAAARGQRPQQDPPRADEAEAPPQDHSGQDASPPDGPPAQTESGPQPAASSATLSNGNRRDESGTLTSPEDIRVHWNRSLEAVSRLPTHQRYAEEARIERQHEQLLRRAGDPAPHRRLAH